MKEVKVNISNVDDGATVYHNGIEIMHVHFMHEGERAFNAAPGDLLTIVVHNLTGGEWKAKMSITVDGQSIYKNMPSGNSLVGQNEAFRKEISL